MENTQLALVNEQVQQTQETQKTEKSLKREMVRYNLFNSNRKDTLYTFRDGDVVFFGVSRCNFKAGDKFDREKGLKIARGRALKAQQLVLEGKATVATDCKDVTFFASMGAIPVIEVKSLISYFRSLPTTFFA